MLLNKQKFEKKNYLQINKNIKTKTAENYKIMQTAKTIQTDYKSFKK